MKLQLSISQFLFILLLIGVAPFARAGPYVEAGDPILRSDIQRLADAGVISGTVSTWPIAWGPIIRDLRDADMSSVSPAIADAIIRVRNRAEFDTHSGGVTYRAKIGVADKPTSIRGFQNTPRGDLEVSAGLSWLGDWASVDVNVQGVDSGQDKTEFRADGSFVGLMVGNWSLAASTQERWWGPGWDGNLILSNNARPIPSLVIDRVFTDGFRSKWLRWIGPWDLNVMFGQLESERQIPRTQFFGMRFNFRPLRSLEIGVSRTAQWCGDGRPCSLDTFADLLLGRDNSGDAGVNPDSEPGNQLAGIDVRWSPALLQQKFSVYGQFIGEDEAGGLPSRWIGQLGGEWRTYLFNRWSTQVFAEAADTSCQFYESRELFNCAYNHSIYQTGYRYRSRSIGHAADNDSRIVSVGVLMADADDKRWQGIVRFGEINRGGPSDNRHSLTPFRKDLASIDLLHSRVFAFGVLEVGLGFERVDDAVSSIEMTDTRFFFQWRSSY